MNSPMLAYFIPADQSRKVEACILMPHPLDGDCDEVSYLPSMYLRMHCRIVERLACAPVPNACVWADEEALCKGDAPPMNIRASILTAREVYGDCILAGDDGERTVQCEVKDSARFFAMLNLLASTVSAVMSNESNERSE